MARTTVISDIIRVLKAANPRMDLSDLEGRAVAEALMGFRRPKYLASGMTNPPHSPKGSREDLTAALLKRLAKRPSRNDKQLLDLITPSERQLRNLAGRITGDLFNSNPDAARFVDKMGQNSISNMLRQAGRGEEVLDRGVPSLIDLLTNPNVR
jgi:hypothetical protein